MFDGLARTDAVPQSQQSDHKYQVRNFQEQQGQHFRKLRELGETIKNKQMQFTESITRVRASMTSNEYNGDGSMDQANLYLQ